MLEESYFFGFVPVEFILMNSHAAKKLINSRKNAAKLVASNAFREEKKGCQKAWLKRMTESSGVCMA